MIGARIMVVEDERIVALHLREQLLRLGYDVAAPVSSGEMALRQVEVLKPQLILMDIHIDGAIDGIETAARIPVGAHIPIIYLTAYSEQATLDRARMTKPYGYLVKPFSERELHATIQMALERSRAEQVERNNDATLRQIQKMEAIGQLAGGVAHDFNNLLGVIIGNLDCAVEHGLSDSELVNMIEEALGAALRGASLTRHLLAYSRQQALEPRVLQIDQIVTQLTGLLRRALGETIRIRTILPADLWHTRLDPNQLENALLNLAVNARDAMPEGGTLTIEAENFMVDDDTADSMIPVPPGPYVLVAVSDTGMGMAKDVVDRAFEPFFTTKPEGAGTGLGLSMVYGFVRQSNGHVKIYSELGHGTSIKLFFPAIDITAPVPALAAGFDAAVMPLARPDEVIFVVEDDAALRKLVTGQLRRLGYSVIAAEDALMGRPLLADAARVDLLLTDVVLPDGVSGAAFAEEGCKSRPDLKVLFMSGYPRDALAKNGILAEGTHLLMKPFRKADLARKLRQMLDQGTTEAG
jgi:signal transduction histidine kinase